LLAHGRWFSPASSTSKTGRHDIAEILLKVALNTKKINQSLRKSAFIATLLVSSNFSCSQSVPITTEVTSLIPDVKFALCNFM
jgi:hypothetical protein